MNNKQYICSGLTQLFRCDDEWILTNPALDSSVCIDPPGSDLITLLLLLLDWTRISRSEQDIVNWMTIEGIERNEAVLLVHSFIRAGLLVSEGSELPWVCLMNNYPSLREVVRYVAFRQAVCFVDYTDPHVLEQDRDAMEDFERSEPPPSIYKRYQNTARLSLGHPATCPPHDSFGRLSHLLFWGYGRLREVAFHQLPAMLKAVPSMGARHPFEVYVLYDIDNKMKPGFYHYVVEKHELEYLSSTSKVRLKNGLQSDQGTTERTDSLTGISLITTVIFDRFQWRYRHAWNYKDIFYDLGHIKATLKLVADELSMVVKPIDLEIEMPEEKLLYEEVIAVYKLECL
jgi:SagB-type dehydrogenase family enzyme